MKKISYVLMFVLGLNSSLSFSQEPYPCHTDQKEKEFFESLSPAEKIQFQQDKIEYNAAIQQYISEHPELLSPVNTKSIKFTIPVVFHVIHQGGAENISEEQVLDAIAHMNRDFQKQNSEWPQVVSQFLPLVADAEISFKLAKLDPNGNCTNGITRTFSATTSNGSGSEQVDAVKNAHGNWPGNKYLNIFVARYIGGAAGYTMYPNNWLGGSMNNGIFVKYDYVGGIGGSSQMAIHTLSHEVGHWLNLPHTWGSSNDPGLPENCDMDDGIQDTPNTIGWTTCNLSGSSCGSSLDNVENFMEYSYCSKMFTLGQKAHMHAALNSSVGGRNKIWTPENLVATGISLPDFLCKAAFKSNRTQICAGESVTFNDLSYSGVTGRTWEFQGGNPTISNNKNPVITYNNPGTYEVALIATDGVNFDTIIKTAYITVLENGTSLPFVEGFENVSILDENSKWFIENQGGNAEFEVTDEVSYTGKYAVKLENFGQDAGNIDAIDSKPIDLSFISGETGVTLSFRYAYRKRKSSNDEILKIKISNDCGVTWAQRHTVKGNNLSNKVSGNYWRPNSENDWTTVHVTNVTSAYWVDNFRVRFEFESDGGNNIFIDDINIYSGEPSDIPIEDVASIETQENEFLQNFIIYPNPAKNIVNIDFSVLNNQNLTVDLVNIMGQKIQSHVIKAAKGRNLIELNTENVGSGIYFIKINASNAQQVKRLIIR